MLRLFLKELAHRWVLHTLAVIMFALVVSVLIVQGSVNKSAETRINELSHQLGQSMLVVPDNTDLENFYAKRYGDAVMPEAIVHVIKNSPLGSHVSMVDPRLYGNIAVQGHDLILVGYQVEGPAFFGGNTAPAAVGAAAARTLDIKPGDTLRLGGTNLLVRQVLDPPPKGYDMAVYTPLPAAQQILGKTGSINALHMGGCWCEMDVPAFTRQVENTLPGTMAITVKGMAKAQTEINSIMERYTVVIWIAGSILGLGTIALLLIYIFYKEGRDIGLLLCIGFTPGKIVAKNTLIGILTAVFGVAGGSLLSLAAMDWLGTTILRVGLAPPVEYFVQFAAGSVLAGFLTALLLSLYMVSLEPTTLLREE